MVTSSDCFFCLTQQSITWKKSVYCHMKYRKATNPHRESETTEPVFSLYLYSPFTSDRQIKAKNPPDLYILPSPRSEITRFTPNSHDNHIYIVFLFSPLRTNQIFFLCNLPESNIKKLKGNHFFRPGKYSGLIMESHGKIMEFYIKDTRLLRLRSTTLYGHVFYSSEPCCICNLTSGLHNIHDQ